MTGSGAVLTQHSARKARMEVCGFTSELSKTPPGLPVRMTHGRLKLGMAHGVEDPVGMLSPSLSQLLTYGREKEGNLKRKKDLHHL